MEDSKKIKLATIFRYTARISLLIFSVLIFVFALLSGAETFGGGFVGIVKNSSNALPWLVLLVFLFVAWKKELLGGILVSILGIAMMFFFNIRSNGFMSFAFFLCLFIIIFGSMFILSWFLRK